MLPQENFCFEMACGGYYLIVTANTVRAYV